MGATIPNTMVVLWVLAIFLVFATKYSSTKQCVSYKTMKETMDNTVNLQKKNLTSLSELDRNYGIVNKLLLDNNVISKIQQLTVLSNLFNMTYLSLRWNKINSLTKESFPKLHCLSFLDLRDNPFIVDESPEFNGVFGHIPFLKILKLPNGNIPAQALMKLHQLEELHMGLVADKDAVLPKELSSLPNLRVLNFAGGNVSSITRALLDNIRDSSVQEISFRSSQIQSIEQKSFTNFRNLKTINLACNQMTNGFVAILESLKVLGSTPLDTLIMDGVNNYDNTVIITPDIICTDLGKRVRRLSFRSNMVIGMHINATKCVPNLEVASFGYYNYPEFFLNAHLNRLSVAEIVLSLPLKVVDASYVFAFGKSFKEIFCTADKDINADGFFPRPLTSYPLVDLPKTSQNYTDILSFISVPTTLEHIKADHMGLNHLKRGAKFDPFPPDNNIKVLDFSHNNFFDSFPATGNLYQLQIMDLSYNLLQKIPDESMATLETSELRYLNISHNRLYVSSPTFENTFQYLSKLVYLDLSHNALEMIHPNAFVSNTNLTSLILRENNLDEKIFLKFSPNCSLTSFDISGNAFHYLSRSFTQILDTFGHVLELKLTGNSLICDCNSVDFILWFQLTKVNIYEKSNIMCSYQNESFSLAKFDISILKEDCDDNIHLEIVLASISISVAIMLIVVFGVYKWRWHIRWYFYTLKRMYRKKHLLFDDDLESLFNAYVIYNDEKDVSFVFQTLRPAFETNGRCRLFLNGRDDRGGNTKADNVIEGMNRSNYVLAIVTPNFLEDEMCEFALHMSIVKGINSLMILLVHSPDLSSMSQTLRGVLSPKTKLPKYKWPDGEKSGQIYVISKILEHLGTEVCNSNVI